MPKGAIPVLERILPKGRYVANDARLNGDGEDHQMIILTGPNIAVNPACSSKLRISSLLAQMGSSRACRPSLISESIDRIFHSHRRCRRSVPGTIDLPCRNGETTQCCLSATSRSLILLDEVGRGTSTYDGVAITWSVSEYLAKEVRARTIFATHYHELNGLASFFPQITNYQVLVKETDGHVEFIRSVVPGGASLVLVFRSLKWLDCLAKLSRARSI